MYKEWFLLVPMLRNQLSTHPVYVRIPVFVDDVAANTLLAFSTRTTLCLAARSSMALAKW